MTPYRKVPKGSEQCQYDCTGENFVRTVRMIEMPRFSVAKLLLHQYRSDLAHISDLYSLVIGMYKYEI